MNTNDGVVNTHDMNSELSRLNAKGFTQESCYTHSFGALPDGTRYVDNLNNYDLRKELGQKAKLGMERLQAKAMTPTSGGTYSAYGLFPLYVDNAIVDVSRKYTPLVEMFPRVTNMSLSAVYNRVTAKGAAYTANPDAPLPEADDTYTTTTVAIKFLYSVGRVLGPALAVQQSFMMAGFQPQGDGMVNGNVFSDASAPNAKQREILMKARALKELEENLIVNGDASTDATQFSGIVKLQGITNRIDLDGAALAWLNVEQAIQAAFDDGGRPKIAIASSAVVTDLRVIMVDTFNYRPSDVMNNSGLPFGVPPQLMIDTMVGRIPVFPSMFLSNTSGSKSIYFLDTDYIEMRVLQDMTYEELANTNDSRKFMLKIYECMVMRAPEFNSFIANIL